MHLWGNGMAGYRGGYAPFYDAVSQLTLRGVFDAGEVTGTQFATKVGSRDEYHIAFDDGYYPACTYRVCGDTIVVADDSIAGLHIERFKLHGGQIRLLQYERQQRCPTRGVPRCG